MTNFFVTITSIFYSKKRDYKHILFNREQQPKLIKFNNYKTILTLFLVFGLGFFNINRVNAQGFDCPRLFYQVISGELKSLNPVTGLYSAPINSNGSGYNNGGYNEIDGLMYALINQSGGTVAQNHIIRILADGTIVDLGNLGVSSFSGDVDDNDALWYKVGASFSRIDNVSTLPANGTPSVTVVGGWTGSGLNVADVAFINDGANRRLWGARNGQIGYWDLDTQVRGIKTVTGLPSGLYGAAYSDNSKRLYVSNNAGGIYVINDYLSATPSAQFLIASEATSSNDGFACPSAQSAFDQDGDDVLDPFDGDADGDGILNTVESGGANPYADADGDGRYDYMDTDAGNDLNNDGIVDTFDLDSDGIPNHMDLDSDNDGCFDVIEAGHTDLDNDGVLGTSPVTVDSNGLITGQGGYTGTNVAVTFAGPDIDNDGIADACDPTDDRPDTDGDGVKDYADLDDDNDGILDTDEGCDPSNIPPGNRTTHLTAAEVSFDISGDANNPAVDALLNAITITGNPEPLVDWFPINSVSYQFANPQATSQFIRDNGATTVNITNGAGIFNAAILDANQSRNLRHYLSLDGTISTTDYVNYRYNAPFVAAENRYILVTERAGNNRMTINAIDANGNIIGTAAQAIPGTTYINTGFVTDYNQNINITVYPLTALLPAGQNIHGIRITQPGGPPAAVGDGGDHMIFVMTDQETACTLDTDNDGIPNHLDTDSDNDGCPDAIEGGGAFTATNLDGNDRLTGGVNNTTGIPTVAGAGQTTTVAVITDGPDVDNDGIADSCDIDNDNDGNPDVTDPHFVVVTTEPDTGNANPGVASTINILDNDDFLDNLDGNNVGTTIIVDAGTGTAAGIIAFDTDTGDLIYTPTAGEVSTTVTVDYTVCNSDPDPDVCSTNTVTIIVGNPDTDMDGNPDATDPNPNAPTTSPDSGSTNPSVATTIDILANDDYLDNLDSANLGTTTLVDAGTGTAAGTIVFDTDTGELTYTPTAGEAGTDVTVDYTVCNSDTNPDTCSTNTVTITVGNPDTDGDGNPDATDPNPNIHTTAPDSGNANPGIASMIDILANDDYLDNDDPINVGTTGIEDVGTGTAVGTISFDASTGELIYTPTAGEAGTTVTVDYRVCNTDANPGVCSANTVTITVGNPDTDMDGNPDATDPHPNAPTTSPDTGSTNPSVATTIDILANDDYLDNLDGNNVGTTTLVDAGTGTAVGTIVFDTDTGELTYTPTAGEAGTTVTIDYTVCNSDTNPDTCSTNTVTITVGNPDTDMDGNPDATDPNPNAPTTSPDSGVADVEIAVTIDILSNDDYLDNLDGDNVGTTTLVDAGTGTAVGIRVFDTDTGELIYMPTAGEAGTDVTVDYTVCNSDTNPDTCSTNTVTITVGNPDTDMDGNPDATDPNPNAPTTSPDSGSANPDVAATIDVLSNDDYLDNLDGNNVGTTTLVDAGTGTAVGTIVFDTDTGELIYTPTAGEAGTDVTIDYTVCNSDPDPDVCSTNTVTITVGNPDTDMDGNPDATDPNPNAPTTSPDSGSANPSVATTIDILANDDYLDNLDGNNVGTTTLVDAGTGTAVGTIVFDTDTGELTYTPAAGEAGTDVTIDYTVCNSDTNPDTCSTNTVTITVGNPDTDMDGNPDATDPNPNAPTTSPDTGSANPSVATTIDILSNDDYLDNLDGNNVGTTTLVDAGTGTAVGTIVFDTDTGELIYTPTAGEAGTTVTIDYTVCNSDTNPDTCSTNTVTITVGNPDTDMDGNPDSTDPNPNAPTTSPDSGVADVEIAVTIDILANDDYLDNLDGDNVGTTTLVDAGTGTAAGTIVFDTDTGELTYTPAASEAGTDVTIDYTVCNSDTNPDTCSTNTVTITISDPDSDGDGVTDGQELADNTNPNDPCSYNVASQVIENVSDDWNTMDCDGDGVINGTEILDVTNPQDMCDFNTDSRTLNPSDEWNTGDCDNDGQNNKDEWDSDNDGDGPDDCDNDFIPDFLDTDLCKIEIPKLFTPNGDGENDVFEIPHLAALHPNFEMKIFNRWGNIVYDYKNNGKTQPDWWDGFSTGRMTLNDGKKVPTGTYFYIINLKNGNKEPQSGWIYLNR